MKQTYKVYSHTTAEMRDEVMLWLKLLSIALLEVLLAAVFLLYFKIIVP